MAKQKLDNKNKVLTVKQLKEFVANLPEQNPHTGYAYEVYIGSLEGYKHDIIVGATQDNNGNVVICSRERESD